MDRDDSLINLRPKVEVDFNKNLPIELFQSNTLRPVLKFQNQSILRYFKFFIDSFHPKFEHYSSEVKNKTIRNLIKQNTSVKSKLAHLIIAMFTSKELDFYLLNKKEIDKRLNELLIERINSQLVV